MTDHIAESLNRMRSHGTRTRYQQGCRCLPCRASAAKYQLDRVARRRAGVPPNGLVPIARAQKHLLRLRKKGLGLKAIAEFSEMNVVVIKRIRVGAQRYLRQNNERRILSVTPDLKIDSSLVSSDKAFQMVLELVEEGFTKREIGKRIGRKGAIRLPRKGYILARTEMKVEKLYNRYMEVA